MTPPALQVQDSIGNSNICSVATRTRERRQPTCILRLHFMCWRWLFLSDCWLVSVLPIPAAYRYFVYLDQQHRSLASLPYCRVRADSRCHNIWGPPSDLHDVRTPRRWAAKADNKQPPAPPFRHVGGFFLFSSMAPLSLLSSEAGGPSRTRLVMWGDASAYHTIAPILSV